MPATESYNRQVALRTAASLKIQKVLMKIPVQLSSFEIIDLELTIIIDQELIATATLRFPNTYVSNFSKATQGKLAEIKLSTVSPHQEDDYPNSQSFLHAFYSQRQKESGYLQNDSEKLALRGIATRMLCIVLKFLVQNNYLDSNSTIGLEASGETVANTDGGRIEREKLAGTIYEPLGFVRKQDLGEGDWYMEANIENLIKNCQYKRLIP